MNFVEVTKSTSSPDFLQIKSNEMSINEKVIDLSSLELFDFTAEKSTKFGGKTTNVGMGLGLEGLGCRYLVVQPGRRAFPFHNHVGNDELFIILEGNGIYRYGDERVEISAGFVCGAPKGGKGGAHQIINNSKKELKYLAISTQNDPDICEYPDSNKILAMGIKPGKDFMSAYIRYIGLMENQVNYFHGEED